MIAEEATILVNGRAEISDEGTTTIIAETLIELNRAVQHKARELVIRLPNAPDYAQLCESIKNLLEQTRGDCDVFVELISEGKLVRMRAHPSLKVQGSAEIEAALHSLSCEVRWEAFATATRAVAASGAG